MLLFGSFLANKLIEVGSSWVRTSVGDQIKIALAWGTRWDVPMLYIQVLLWYCVLPILLFRMHKYV